MEKQKLQLKNRLRFYSTVDRFIILVDCEGICHDPYEYFFD